MESIKAELQLTDEQANKLKQIMIDYREQVQKMKGVQRNSGQLQSEAFTKAKAEYRDEVKSVLSKEQYEQWIKIDEAE